ncbi:MAG: ribonuclease HII [Nitrososphaerales archaeon]
MEFEDGKIAGVDDAGRGAILGPLVIAGISMKEDKLDQLVRIGVKDSKLLSPNRRVNLYHQIMKIADNVSIIKLKPEQIDDYVLKGKKYKRLNYLEALSMAKVIESLDAEVVYVDASDVDVNRFKQDILETLQRKVEIISVHHADRIYPIVSAASIIAKVNRDKEIFGLSQKFGDIGSGYPADKKTVKFLEQWLRRYGEFPPFARKSWKTIKKLLNSRSDETIIDL